MTRDDELRLEQMNAGASGNAEAVTEVRGVGAAPRGKNFLQHLNESAKRALNPIRSKSPAGTEQPVGGRELNAAVRQNSSPVAGVACPDCKKAVSDVPELKRHMTDAHGGWSEQDVAAATAPEEEVKVKRGVLHTAMKANDALAKAVASQNVGAPAAKGK